MAICTLTNTAGYFLVTTSYAYSCPGGKQAFIKSIVVVNNDAVGHWFEVRLNNGGSARLVTAIQQPLAAGARYSDTDGYCLATGNDIEVIADASNHVSYFISIIEESV
jgi:hypothetical protein